MGYEVRLYELGEMENPGAAERKNAKIYWVNEDFAKLIEWGAEHLTAIRVPEKDIVDL